MLGANTSHLGTALSAAPVSHLAFFGSLVAMEGSFLMYYREWTLFQVLPVIGAIGAVIWLSGTRALGEVQSRRMAGER
jgi:oligosaccharyltransferase complex subunit delta (ribophorin II)